MKCLRFFASVRTSGPVRSYAAAKRPNFLFRYYTSSSPLGSIRSDMETVNTTERLAHLRELMKKHEVDIYGIPSLPVLCG